VVGRRFSCGDGRLRRVRAVSSWPPIRASDLSPWEPFLTNLFTAIARFLPELVFLPTFERRCGVVSHVSKRTSVLIVTPRVVWREGLTALLHDTPYKVVASAAGPAQLRNILLKQHPTLAIVGMARQNGNLDETAENVRLLRSSMPRGKVVLVGETHTAGELAGVMALSPDACVFDLGWCDALIKVLDLTFMDQRVFVFGDAAAMSASESAALMVGNNDYRNGAGYSPSPPSPGSFRFGSKG
jgi:hypothetical protein